MKLFYSATSPYARKVLASAIALDIDTQIELVPTNPWTAPPALTAANPLSKVPCLITDDGTSLFDSPVICEYLDSLSEPPLLFPHNSTVRWRVLTQQAIGDGIMDAAVARRREMGLAADNDRHATIQHHGEAITRSLEWLEINLPRRPVDIGSITIACALGYLDLRFGHEPWREKHPKLASWFADFSQNPAIARTAPPPA